MSASNAPGPSTTDLAHDRTDMAHGRTDLAYERSRMASDRTIMAYMRTSTSLIGFGFTIYKFFDYLRDTPQFADFPAEGPRNLGLALLVVGAGMLLFATIQHVVYINRLRKDSGKHFPISVALVGSVCMIIIGFLALMNTILHVGPF